MFINLFLDVELWFWVVARLFYFYKKSELSELIKFNEIKRQKQTVVNVYAAVLGFSFPSLTRNSEWMMQVTLIDETTALPTLPTTKIDFMGVNNIVHNRNRNNVDASCTKDTKKAVLSVRNPFNRSSVNGDTTDKLEHEKKKGIPHVTLMIFSQDKEKLPRIQHAGDIIRIHRVFPQASKLNPFCVN